jgi:hypothetical protein
LASWDILRALKKKRAGQAITCSETVPREKIYDCGEYVRELEIEKTKWLINHTAHLSSIEAIERAVQKPHLHSPAYSRNIKQKGTSCHCVAKTYL